MTARSRAVFGTSLIILASLLLVLPLVDDSQAGSMPSTEWIGKASTSASISAGQRRVFLPLVTEGLRDLSAFIPNQLAGYPQPMTASFGSTQPFDGRVVPGGYAGREWLDEPNSRFVLAMIMNWLTPQAAAQQLSLLKPAHAGPAPVGEEGYIDNTADTDGDPAFRLLVFRRGSYLIIVGSGVLDHAAALPVVVTEVGTQIDARLSGAVATPSQATAPVRLSPRQPSDTDFASDTRPLDGRTVIVGGCPPAGADLVSLRLAGSLAASSSVTGTLKLDDGAANGEITLRFDVTDLGPGRECPVCQVQHNPAQCHLVEVRVYITKIALGAEDGDGPFRGAGDVMVGGEVNVYFNCNGVKAGAISFDTAELGDIGPNQALQLEKSLGTVLGCQCPNSSPTTTFDLLVRDNDDGDAADIIQIVEAAVVKSQTNDDTAKRLDGLKDLAKNRGQDTTGPSPFDELRKRSGNDVGEAHRSEPAPIGK